MTQTDTIPSAPARYASSPDDDLAIEVKGLRKSYGEVEAVRGVDFSVSHGEVFCLLGPNGAGKTTSTEIMEGYRSRSGERCACSAWILRTDRANSASGSGSCFSNAACRAT